MPEPKIKRGWDFDADVVEAFEQWIERVGLQKNAAAQLGLWIVMHLDPTLRDDCLSALEARIPGPIPKADRLLYDERRLLLAFRSLSEDARNELLNAADNLAREADAMEQACLDVPADPPSADAEPLVRDADRALGHGKQKSG